MENVLLEPCRCTAKNGVLCGSCKKEQNYDLQWTFGRCAGYGCRVPLDGSASSPYICIWCSNVLWGVIAADSVYPDLKAI